MDYRCVFRVRQKGGERERERKKKMVDGAARQSGQRGLPILLALEQSKAKRERESSKAPMNNGGATWPGGVRHPSCPGEEERENAETQT